MSVTAKAMTLAELSLREAHLYAAVVTAGLPVVPASGIVSDASRFITAGGGLGALPQTATPVTHTPLSGMTSTSVSAIKNAGRASSSKPFIGGLDGCRQRAINVDRCDSQFLAIVNTATMRFRIGR